jgi:hypothetical protein
MNEQQRTLTLIPIHREADNRPSYGCGFFSSVVLPRRRR